MLYCYLNLQRTISSGFFHYFRFREPPIPVLEHQRTVHPRHFNNVKEPAVFMKELTMNLWFYSALFFSNREPWLCIRTLFFIFEKHDYKSVMSCQKFCSVSGDNLSKHIFSSRSIEDISFFRMPLSLFAWLSPFLGGAFRFS